MCFPVCMWRLYLCAADKYYRFRLGERLWYIILAQTHSGPQSVSVTHTQLIALGYDDDQKRIDPIIIIRF